MVTAATSLITTLAQKSPDDFKTSVSLAVARLSRVRLSLLLVGFVLFFCRPLQLMRRLRLPSDCDLGHHGPARLHVLLCGGALVVRQAAASAAVLPSTW